MIDSSKTTIIPKETEESKTNDPYTDEILGLSFSFPSVWGSTTINEEEGFTENVDQENLPTDEKGQFIFDGVVNRALSFSGTDAKSPTVFLVAHNPSVSSLGRGGYWGDQARQLTSEKGLQQWCQTTLPDYTNSQCTLSQNPQGILIARKHSDEKSVYGNITTDIDEYGIYHAGHAFSGIILSTEAMGSEKAETLKNLVETISFE